MRYSKAGYWGLQAAAVVFGIGGALAVKTVMPTATTSTKALAISLVVIGAIGIALLAYRYADEIILETHRTAWFSGSMAALVIAAPMLIAIRLRIVTIPPLLSPQHYLPSDFFADGAICALLLQCAGFFAFWAYYNLRRRG